MAAHYLYNNLNKPGHFSLLHKGKVIARPRFIKMEGVEFTVSQASRNRCIKEQVRNVHAKAKFFKYELFDKEGLPAEIALREISYNPYYRTYFFYRDSHERVDSVDKLVGVEGRIYEII